MFSTQLLYLLPNNHFLFAATFHPWLDFQMWNPNSRNLNTTVWHPPVLSYCFPSSISIMSTDIIIFLLTGILFVIGKWHLFQLNHNKHPLSGHPHRCHLSCRQSYQNVCFHSSLSMLYDIFLERRQNTISLLLTSIRDGSGGARSIGEICPDLTFSHSPDCCRHHWA